METTVVGGVVKAMTTEATKGGVTFVTTRLNYLVRYKKMVDDLKNAVSILSAHKADSEQCIEKARGEDKEVTHGMKRWLSEVTKLEEKVKKMVNDCEENMGILELGKQYKLGKDADKLMVEAEKLQKEWSTLTILHSSTVPPFSARPRKEFNDYISMRGILNEVIDALKDEKKCLLAIYGMGGIGKTTLIDQIGRQMEEEKVFDVVIAVELSQNQGVSQIQDLIAEQLGKNFKANSVEQKSGELASALKRAKSILIMLDNLWTEVDLRKIGIPFSEDHNGCKILLTTRKIEVCDQMKTDAKFSVDLLSEEESWDLFKSEAGEVVTITEIESIARKVACECAKLPLALVVVGRALRGKHERDTWDNALRQLRESNPKDLINVEEKVFKCLELSYNHLNRDDWKLLFLLCSLFPEGYELSEDELTRVGIGEDMFGKFNNLEEARGNMHMLVLKLIDSCLLLTKKVKTIKMHDVVRDVAIYIASRHENGFFIESGSRTNELLGEEVFKQFKRISLMNSGISELPTIRKGRVDKKNLHIKGADHIASWVRLLLREVEDLCVDNCFWNAAPLLEFAGLETLTGFSNLKILRISNCQRIAYLIRRMANSALEDAFVKLEELYLTNLDNLNGVSEGTLKELTFGNTRKIHITACKGMFSVMPYSLLIRMHHNLEELRVRDCEELRGVFYFLSYETSVVMFDHLKDLYLLDLPKLCDVFHDQVPKGSFRNLKDVHIQGCNELKYIFPASVINGFQCLEKLVVSDNANMEEVISDDSFILDENAFPKLIVLMLAYVPKLTHFYKVETEIKIFSWPSLKNLKLGVCKGLKMLPIGSDSAPQLKKIELVEQSDRDWYTGLVWDNATTSKCFETLVSGSERRFR
ncbi:hypothetical protein LUZ60_010759 [Juncus effusus]|nr:hypothetical protein LUZ60_010759 [Juncus effusus]